MLVYSIKAMLQRRMTAAWENKKAMEAEMISSQSPSCQG